MRSLRPARGALFTVVLMAAAAADAANLTLVQNQDSVPPEMVQTTDLTTAQPEKHIAPSAVYALPAEEFPNAVVVDLKHRKAYAATEFVAINVLSLVAAVWVEVLAAAVACVAVWWFRRVARRPQKPGQPYCRQCNYLLASLAGEVCPECGTATTGKGRIVGRRRWPRLSLATVLLGAAVGLYVGFTRRAPRLVWPENWPAWWSTWLDDVAQANSKYTWLIQHSRVLTRLEQIDLDTSGRMRTIWTGRRSESDHINALFLSDDCSRLTVWHSASLRVWNVQDWSIHGEITGDEASAVSIRFATLVEVSDDGRTALVIGPPPAHWAVSFDLDAPRERWRTDQLAIGDLTNLRLLHHRTLDRFVVAGELADSGTTELMEWFVDDTPRPNLMRHVTTSAHALGPRLARNGLGPLIWASNLYSVEGWDLQTERVERRIDLPERCVLLSAWPGDVPRLITTTFDRVSRTWILDTRTGQVLAECTGTPLHTRSTEVLSDGRTLAVWGYGAGVSQPVLQLFDLSALEAESRRPGS